MQTFLPFASFDRSAQCLDDKRLGKQRSECRVIADNVLGIADGWSRHPAVRMWEGYLPALLRYWKAIVVEWKGRGYQDSTWLQLNDFIKDVGLVGPDPWWIGVEEFHASHRSKLVEKMPDWYKWKLGWADPPGRDYWWPSHHIPSLVESGT
jgi:hypothetical protein